MLCQEKLFSVFHIARAMQSKQNCYWHVYVLPLAWIFLTPSGHRQIRDVITTGIDVWAQNAERRGGGMDHTSIATLTNQLCSGRGVVRVFEYSINVMYYKYGRNQSWRY